MHFRPMDSAPRDGAHVLLLVNKSVIEGWFDKKFGNWDVVSLESHGCGCCGRCGEEPDGWMELPNLWVVREGETNG